MEVVVVGSGFAGACAAWILREQYGVDATLLEQEAEPGGMLRTLRSESGLPYEYGPRVVSVFRGTEEIIPFLGQFLDLEERDVYQGTRLRPDYPVIPFPVDRQSLRDLPCGDRIEEELAAISRAGRPAREGDLREYLESSVGPTLTELAFEGFNEKFWGRRLEQMPAEWGKLRRLERIAEAGEFRLPSRAPHYYPRGGFNQLFDEMLDGLDLRTGVQVDAVRANGTGATVVTDEGAADADLVITTAPIDALMGYSYGPLEWRGYRVEVEEIAADSEPSELGTAPDGVPFAWVYTPWPETPVCRTTDFGVIHQGSQRGEPSVVLREIVDESVAMYPVWWENDRFYRYLEQATQIPGLVPIGRLGLYKYVTMDSTLGMVQRLAESLETFLESDASGRFEILRAVRGDWQN
jgi:UDP-galactopyranose mutase